MSKLKWYFQQGLWSIFTVPLFLLFVYFFLFSLWGTIIKGSAFIIATWAVYGIIGIIAALALFYFVALPFVGPPILYAWLIGFLPDVWLQRENSVLLRGRSTILAIGGVLLVTWIMHWVAVWSIGWVADHNPCAAYQAGVTGSIPPDDSCS